MGSLNNLYISQSYQSLVHFATDNTASATLIELEDGLGNGLGVSMNTNGDISASGQLNANDVVINHSLEVTGAVDIYTSFSASTEAFLNSFQPYYSTAVYVTGSYPAAGGNPPSLYDVQPGWICNGINVTDGVVLSVSQSIDGLYIVIDDQYPQPGQDYVFTGEIEAPVRITGSLDVSNDITASNLRIKNDLFVDGTIHTPELIATAITSSTIFSSGSNQFGDSIADTQTLVGDTILSGSLTVDGPIIHRGEVEITGSLKVSGDISSSTLNGIGNVTAYSTSVDARLDYLEGPFSTSVDQRLDSLEITSQSLNDYTQSLRTAFTASGVNVAFNGDISVVGTISAYEIHTTIESSSVIFSSGSNVLGDAISDTQTLNGTVYAPNALVIAGVDFIPFSQSVDFRLDELEAWSSSIDTNFATQAELTATRSIIEGELNATASVLQNQIDQKLFTSSFNAYTQSFSSSVASQFTSVTGDIASLSSSVSASTYNLSSSIAVIDNAQTFRIDTLSSYTGSYATTGSNSFIGTESISGSLHLTGSMGVNGNMVYSGSVRGKVTNLIVSSNSASMDCSLGNFFTITLNTSGTVTIVPTNIQPGETITLRLTQPAGGYSSVNLSNTKYPNGYNYLATPQTNAVDIITFLSFDTGSLYYSKANQFV
jgi:cytoskeletal protein CcmA (bactofilin family)